MSEDEGVIVEVDESEDASSAMTTREWTLISRLNQICVMMARARSREDVVDEVREKFMLRPSEAERWVQKAEEYMASGAVESIDVARAMYHMRLQEIYSLSMAHAVKDATKITTRPTRVIDEQGEFRVIRGEHIEVRPNTLDTGALQVALKAAREIAHVMGARPRDGRRGVSIGQVNIQNNGQGAAREVADLTNAQLARLAGMDIVDGEATDGQFIEPPSRSEVLSDAAPEGPAPGEDPAVAGDGEAAPDD